MQHNSQFRKQDKNVWDEYNNYYFLSACRPAKYGASLVSRLINLQPTATWASVFERQ